MSPVAATIQHNASADDEQLVSGKTGGGGVSEDVTREYLVKAGNLKGMLNQRARGGTPSEQEYSRLRAELLAIEVLLEGQRQTKTGYFWPYLGDETHPHVVVDFSLDKRKEHPQRFGLHRLRPGRRLLGLRRLLFEQYRYAMSETRSRLLEPRSALLRSGPRQRSGPCRRGARFHLPLFALEAQAKRGRLAETEVLALRQREAVPILADFKTWLTQTQPQVLPKSPMNDALRYTINQWEALHRYSDTGFVALDNNATERNGSTS